MKVFVPRFQQDFPQPNDAVLNVMFAEIDERDLRAVVEAWKKLRNLQNRDDIKLSLRTSMKEICAHPTKKHALAPYLLRPHITLHGGSQVGNELCRDMALESTRELGHLVARNGFNLWYGGGDTGLMGEIQKGFLEQAAVHRFPDQYVIQISPAPFVFKGEKSLNGLRPKNEGLSQNSDIAIVLPEFAPRRHMLDIMLGRDDAAITSFGAMGSMDEITDIAAHIKTGLIDTNQYILNMRVPALGGGFWDPLKQQFQNFVRLGFQDQKSIDILIFLPTPSEIFDHLMAKLNGEGRNPHQVYEQRLKQYKMGRPEGIATPALAVSAPRLG